MNKKIWVMSVILLLSLILYSYYFHSIYFPGPKEFINNPEKYVGTEVEYQGKITGLTKDGYYFVHGLDKIWVSFSNPREPVFGVVTVYGIAQADGTIKGLSIRYNDYLWFIYPVSIIGALILLLIFLKEWKIKRWRFVPCRTG